MKDLFKSLINDEKGEAGIKYIAITVAVIVLIGVVMTIIQGRLPGWIDQIWTLFMDQIQGLMS
ncbi:MAG: hypothetical protein PHV03_08270 [Desulfitobacteriaceae bacterium]|nr:hypothetical protein [Desulfitobacteriaceae bacterium]MDD4401880.1 hypothetical protein [Desulfitobacteriaceae bacterium]